ncbi:MAG: response regulator, partial [Thermoguttaceae bacterium]
FKSILGVGSVARFSIVFPLNLSTESPDDDILRDRKILIAEDNIVYQHTLSQIVKKVGGKPHVVENGKESVNALEQDEFDLVLMDTIMPVLDGFQATNIIRNSPRFSIIPIIALVHNWSESVQEKCLQAGMNDTLIKPIDAIQLKKKVANCLLSKKAI